MRDIFEPVYEDRYWFSETVNVGGWFGKSFISELAGTVYQAFFTIQQAVAATETISATVSKTFFSVIFSLIGQIFSKKKDLWPWWLFIK